MIQIVWSEQARQEWANQYRFYFSRNPDAARRLRRMVMDAVTQLCEFPYSGRPGSIEGTRELMIAGIPFVLVYDVNLVRLELLQIDDGRQDWKQ